MPDIGETLREARMRRRIDIAEVETATKIRAKYLRALENEEWSLLPGTTFVKTFLRTYAEYLELDARALVEEYKQRYERPAHGELAPFGGSLGGPRSRPQRRRSRASFGPALVVAAGVVIVLLALYLLGVSGSKNDDNGGGETPAALTTPTPTPKAKKKSKRKQQPAAPTRVRLQVEATGDVYVCLTDAGGRKLLDGATLHAGQVSKTFRSRRLHARFGNNAASMRVAGKRYSVARSTTPVDYDLRPGRAPRRLPATTRTACK
jgi:cytoskeleton protein RodZ